MNGLVYLFIVYLQTSSERRKKGCIIGIVWGLLSCGLSVVFALIASGVIISLIMRTIRWNRVILLDLFMITGCLTWLVFPFSIIILCCNRSSKKSLPITSIPSSKV